MKHKLQNKNIRGAGIAFVVMIILAMSLMAGTIVISGKFVYDEKAISATQSFMQKLALAISSTNYQSAPKYQRSYEQDVGSLPSALTDLQSNPGVSACAIDTTARKLSGWCGPYWTFNFTGQDFSDAWGHALTFNTSSRFLRSKGSDNINNSGSGDDLTQQY